MSATAIRRLELPLGESIPVLGQGTAGLGEDSEHWDAEVAALQLGLDLGMTLVETGEMYGDGAAEELVGDALDGRRNDVFLVTKVGPAHAARHAGSRSWPARRWNTVSCWAIPPCGAWPSAMARRRPRSRSRG